MAYIIKWTEKTTDPAAEPRIRFQCTGNLAEAQFILDITPGGHRGDIYRVDSQTWQAVYFGSDVSDRCVERIDPEIEHKKARAGKSGRGIFQEVIDKLEARSSQSA